MSDPKSGTIVFVYPDGNDDPEKCYPAIVMGSHEGEKAVAEKPAVAKTKTAEATAATPATPATPSTVDLIVLGAWHGSPVVERLGVPLLDKWDAETVRPFALAAPYEKPEPKADEPAEVEPELAETA